MKALSIRQPWAWLILHGGKDIENREWGTLYRGELAIQAAKGMTIDEYQDAVEFVASFHPELAARIPAPGQLVRGAIVGTVQMLDCVTEHHSSWFQGRYGLVLREPQAWHRPLPARGALGLWEWTPDTLPSIADTVGPLFEPREDSNA